MRSRSRFHPESAFPFVLLAWVCAQAQPSPAPTSGDAPCEDPPREAIQPDSSQPDSEGFHSLFNGSDFGGWWQNCRTHHSQGNRSGAVFRVDPARKAIYSTQRGSGAGGVLMTKARYRDYELEFDFWPGWDDDHALLNRADTLGKAYATTLSYLGGASMGGVWGESGLMNRDIRPFAFNSPDKITIPGRADPEGQSDWTRVTRGLKAAGEAFPCPESGCTQEDWGRLWNFGDWNQIRIQFRGGRDSADPIRARSWFRKPGAAEWVPLCVDTTLRMRIGAGYIGLRVHGGGEYGSPKGTWYRNIRWKPWVPAPSAALRPTAAPPRPVIRFEAAGRMLRIAPEGSTPVRGYHIFSLEGKPMAEQRGGVGALALSTAGWRRGVYFLRRDGGTYRDGTPFFIP